ncbi:MAG: AMP-binding protein [Dermatophilaceae bacterium]
MAEQNPSARDSSGIADSYDLSTWAKAALELPWTRPYDELWVAGETGGEWFAGGQLNASVICVDRHLPQRADRVAILWEGEPGDRRSLTFRQLHDEVLALTRGLRGLGVTSGDRVVLHLGWLPETVVAMLACARIGAVHTIIPTPLPAEALADRLEDLAPKILFTQDGAWRRGAVLPLKTRADEALSAVAGVEQTIVVRRTGMDVAWYEGDRWYHDLVAGTRPGQVEDRLGDAAPASLPASHPLIAVNLANRRGRPVTVLHATANVMVNATAVHRRGISAGGVFWCAADVSWLGAQVHGIYGPLACGDTTVMFEGTLDVPTHTRTWEVIQRYGVATLLTSPSVVRTMRGWSHELPDMGSIKSLARVVTMGEPMDPELREWLLRDLGRGDLEVADGWGQVELGGIVRLDHPVDPTGMPDPGLRIVDATGRPVPQGDAGELVLDRPWAGTMCGAEGPTAEVTESHWTRHPSVYATGDLARLEADGSIEFLGRTDEVVSVAGQLVSLTEVREVLLGHPFVRAADVVERKDAQIGRSLAAAVVLATDALPETPDLTVVARDLLDAVREVMGGLARPRILLFVDRFGDELTASDRRKALATLAAHETHGPLQVTWAQILAAAGHTPPI